MRIKGALLATLFSELFRVSIAATPFGSFCFFVEGGQEHSSFQPFSFDLSFLFSFFFPFP